MMIESDNSLATEYTERHEHNCFQFFSYVSWENY